MTEIRITPKIADGMSLVFDDDKITTISVSRGVMEDPDPSAPKRLSKTCTLTLVFEEGHFPQWAGPNLMEERALAGIEERDHRIDDPKSESVNIVLSGGYWDGTQMAIPRSHWVGGTMMLPTYNDDSEVTGSQMYRRTDKVTVGDLSVMQFEP
jgi:hypothetical protein